MRLLAIVDLVLGQANSYRWDSDYIRCVLGYDAKPNLIATTESLIDLWALSFRALVKSAWIIQEPLRRRPIGSIAAL
jgi:hypothetical protein